MSPVSDLALLEVRDIRKVFVDEDFQTPVLKGVNFSLQRGEMVAMLGPSGSGKSTLLSILGTLMRPTSGSLRMLGKELTALAERELSDFRNQQIGFIFQYHHLLPDFTAQENVILPQLVAGVGEADATARANELLGALGLGERLSHRPSQLSGGEQQRVAVARALANRPALVLADEPTGNLDEATADRVFDEFVSLVRGQASAALVATHNERLAARMDRVLRLHEGRVG